MMYAIGIALFALGLLVSVALHECGHMWVARATGMKVRRYFVGFGPTLWSTHRPNRLGSTEYGDLPMKSRGWPQRKVAGCVPRFCKTSDCEQLDAASPAPKENSTSSSGVPRALTRCSSSGTTCAVTVIRNAWMPLIT